MFPDRLKSTLRIFGKSFMLQTKENRLSQYFIATMLIQPVIFTLLSVGTYLYGKKPDFGLFAITGSGLVGIFNNILWTSGEIISRERRYETLSLIMATPTSLFLILLGRSFANALISIFAMGMTFLTGIIAFKLPLGINNPWIFMAGLLLVVLALTCLGLVFGSLFVISRNAGEFIEASNFPVYILSGLSIPLTLLPLWTRPFSAILAPTWGNEILNNAARAVGVNFLPDFLWLIGLSIVYFLVGWFLYKRVEVLAFKSGNLVTW
jgi:ABC-2 type transport system permease protein